MENFTICTPTRYVFGHGAECKAAGLCKEAGWKRVMIVYGGQSAIRSGLLDRVKTTLESAGIATVTLGGVKPNPTDDKVYEGIALGREEDIDSLLAVGGGSVIDTAKAIACGIPYAGDFWDFYCGKAAITEALPLGVVLTIPAAGSEGSGNSVITRIDGLLKLSVRTETLLRPKFACLNPELTFTLPPYQTASGIADMMVHIMERYFSPTENVEVTDRLCEGLLKAIIEEAPKVMADPTNYDARANIMWSGTLAHNGICGCGRKEDWASHFIEHELSALYDVTHGAGLAVITPSWMEYVGERRPSKVAQFGRRVFDITDPDDLTAAKSAVRRLREFFSSIGLPVTLKELGVENPDITRLVKKLHENKGPVIGGYIPLDSEATTAILHLSI
ncbi:MAG: iron-containing alcohol dehydrogenase [Bacteroides sp.]|nr:iron-containing alcohol dehydrogenase [Bacteroides sp.]